MVENFRDAIGDVERRQLTIEVHSPSPDVTDEITAQFATKNVDVTHSSLPSSEGEGFVIIRDVDGAFLASLGLGALDAILSPEVHPPWVLAQTDAGLEDVFDFLDDTLFSSFDRQQMLATAREIEERAWRIGVGTLYAGFQDAKALEAQEDVYERLASHGQLSVAVFATDEWDIDVSVAGKAVEDGEIGEFWFVVYDGGGSDLEKCALLAEEREPGEYYGFWTYDPVRVGELIAYLESTYLDGA